MQIMGWESALIVVLAVVVALFIYDYADNAGWTGSKGL